MKIKNVWYESKEEVNQIYIVDSSLLSKRYVIHKIINHIVDGMENKVQVNVKKEKVN